MYSWLQNPGSGERIVLLGKLSSMSADLVKEREKDCERQSRKDGPRGGQPLPCYLYNKIDPRLTCLSDLLPVFQGNFQSDITATFLLFSSHFLFFFEKYAKQADSIHCIFSNELFPRNISCHVIFGGLPHWFPTVAPEKANFLKSNECIYSKCHILWPDQPYRIISAPSLETWNISPLLMRFLFKFLSM